MQKTSFLNKIDPLLKLWFWLISLVVAFLPLGLYGLVIINLVFLTLVVISEKRVKSALIILSWMLFFLWFNVIVNGFIFLPNTALSVDQNHNFLGSFIYSGGNNFGGVSWWSFNLRSFLRSFVIALRISMLFSASFLLTTSSSIYELAWAVERFFKFLKLFHIKVQPISILLAVIFKLLPTVKSEIIRIKQAQATRGFIYNKCSFLNPFKIKTLFIPVLLSTVKKTETTAFALQAKGYDLNNTNRTHYPLKYNLLNGVFLLVGLLLFSILLIANNWNLVYWENPNYSFNFDKQNFIFLRAINSNNLLYFWQIELIAIG
ncbi:CbiQ family ECF transporter T component [Mycoplasmoides genitalium]|uniref:Uncharacterized protein MG302 n=1 Tax=Mycoplasma genitalium (strain ATCC 33530 / DSM 19775 / NCTC 10195 / G37) TaxID=243273 RepID=Y302_MYCGE|nr:energy-coupling factor transporter transmembrane protein EcfT [Mycoplasmoides genitalium]P47544.1 RecName: Full=Uncharacterized protein MG302 [Mycoplasmoides genitalium G37]ABY79550.1 metal ion ABC transporter, permease protein, putative [synthetic Mycoplasma genitalium JCVI-1.0]AAC71524.1 metal ion ABC transporter, permease protein, putative [Mycoplasmoides genitalium G37]AFQ03137.1 metal ABC transporter permease [Mycoplasmoides genitalium M2321]AFQ04633.1 metal ABC transporter permease [M